MASPAARACEFPAWYQMRRWRATWQGDRLVPDPPMEPGEELTATVETPLGRRDVPTAPAEGWQRPAGP